MLRLSILFYISFLLFFSCHKKQPDISPLHFSEQTFDSIQVELAYSKLDAKNRKTYILDILQNTYKNRQNTENWLLTKVDTSQQVIQDWGNEDLFVLLDALNSAEYYGIELRWAKFLVSCNYTAQYEKANWYVAHIFSNHYSDLKEVDSLQKYVGVLQDAMAKDSANWISLAYFTGNGNLAFIEGQYFNAVINYYEAISFVDTNDIKNLSSLYFNIANTYLNLKYPDKASEFLDKSIAVIGENGLTISQQLIQALIRYKMGNYKEADKIYTQIVNDLDNHNSSILLAQVYSNIGNLKVKEELFDIAYNYFAKSDSICYDQGIDFGILVNHINRAELYISQKKAEQALNELLLAEKLANVFDMPSITLEVYESLSRVYDMLDNKSLANKYFRQYVTIENEIMGDIPRSAIAEWAHAKDKERLRNISSAYEISLQRQKKNVYFAASIISFIILIFSFGFFIISRKNMKLRQQMHLDNQALLHQLELKNKEELTESLKKISTFHAKQWMKDELLILLKELPKAQQQLFNGLKQKLDQGDFEEYLDEFEMRFSNVYEDFYQKLKEHAPDLTPTETRICALMRLNISSKEIAMLTNRSVGTIENNRGSIRKKLNLPSDVNIQEFLLKL